MFIRLGSAAIAERTTLDNWRNQIVTPHIKSDSTVIAERITCANWRKQVVAAQIKQDPSAIETTAKFDLDDNSFVYVRVRAVSAGEQNGPNGNGDYFPEAELRENYKTFIRRGVYLDHKSDSVENAVGIILDAKYWDVVGTNYVELLMAIDKSMSIADKIAKGYATDVSMGAIVERCACSLCNKEATNVDEYCDHLANYMGKEYNGRKIYAVNHGVNFYEESFVNVGADKDAKVLGIIAEQKESAHFNKLLKLADTFNAAKAVSSGQDISEVKSEPGKGYDDATDQVVEKQAAPPNPAKKVPERTDLTLRQRTTDVAQKEVNRTVDQMLVNKVREKLKAMKPEQMLGKEISEEQIASAVRLEVEKKLTPQQQIPAESELHQAVNATLQDLDAVPETSAPVDLGDDYSVVESGKVAGQIVMQLMNGKARTGLFCIQAKAGLFTENELREVYRNQFSLKAEEKMNIEPELKITKENTAVQGQLLTIRYIPGESLEKCAFVARKGNLYAQQSADVLLSAETKKAIVASETTKTAAGKVEYGDDKYDITKGKVDVKIEVGKEETQPGKLTKNLGGVEDGSVSEFDSTDGKVDDNNFRQDKEPIQPAQVVSKYASKLGGKVVKLATDAKTGMVEAIVEGGSIARLAQLWQTRTSLLSTSANKTTAAETKMSKLDNVPNITRQLTEPVQDDPKNHKDILARETPEGPAGAKPSGSLGNEQVKYFAQWDKGTLSGGGDTGWARKVAALSKVKTELETENKVLKATLEKVQKQQDTEKRSALVGAIMQRMAETGALDPDQGDVLALKEKGLDHEDAVAKAASNNRDRQLKELASLDVQALEKLKSVINRVGMNTRTTEPELMKHVDVPILGNDGSPMSSIEDRLASSW